MNLLGEGLTKFFDSGFPSSAVALLQGSNVYNLGGYTGAVSRNTDLEAVSPDCRWYGQLLATVARLDTYRFSDLPKTVIQLFCDAINSCIDYNTSKLIEIYDKNDKVDEEKTKKYNKILLDIKYLEHLKESLPDVVYYGSKAKKINKQSEEKYEVKDFKYPYTTAYYRPKSKYIVMSDEGPQFIDGILRFGNDNLSLILDEKLIVQLGLMSENDVRDIVSKKSNIYSLPTISASEPLFLSTELKLKDYVLKDLIATYLSLINLIEQDTYTIDGARISDTTNLLKLCERVKGLLVTESDMNLLASARLDKNALIRRLFDRVRVIPSIAGELNNLNKLQVTSVVEKLSSLANEKEGTKNELLSSIGFPLDLFNGNTTRWEAGRQNDRYNIRIKDFKSGIEMSTVDNVESIAKLNDDDLKGYKIKVLFTQPTAWEVQNSINKVNNNKEILLATQDILRTANDIINSEGIEDPKSLSEFVNLVLSQSGLSTRMKLKTPESTDKEGSPSRPQRGGDEFTGIPGLGE